MRRTMLAALLLAASPSFAQDAENRPLSQAQTASFASLDGQLAEIAGFFPEITRHIKNAMPADAVAPDILTAINSAGNTCYVASNRMAESAYFTVQILLRDKALSPSEQAFALAQELERKASEILTQSRGIIADAQSLRTKLSSLSPAPQQHILDAAEYLSENARLLETDAAKLLGTLKRLSEKTKP